MDDLSGLEWSSTAGKPAPKAPTIPAGANYYGSMQQTPSPFLSGRNTPLSAQATQQKTPTPPPAKAAAAPADSFSNLLNFGGPAKTTANLSLREQQQRLEAEKRKKAEEQRKNTASQFGNGQFLDALGSGSVSRTASPAAAAPLKQFAPPPNGSKAKDDDDLFAAFNSETKVDNASHYPPPPEVKASPANAPGLDLSSPSAWGQAGSSNIAAFGDDDDDPFGLSQFKAKGPPPALQTGDDDDFLGDLAKPVEEVRRKQPTPPQPSAPQPGKPIEGPDSSSDDEAPPPRAPPRRPAQQPDDFDKAVEQLTAYGFSEEDAQRGLTESGAGLNVQATVNWLLDDAHRRAKAKAQGREPSPSRPLPRQEAAPRDSSRRRDNRSPANEDFAKTASAAGSSIFKAANSLWKTGKKQVAQAYAEFNQEGDPNQPKWMRAAQPDHHQQPARRPAVEKDVTDEAMMLEGGGRPERRSTPKVTSSRHEPERQSSRGPPQPSSAASSGRNTPVPRWQQSAGPIIPDSRTRASKLAAEEDASTYVSPNRRRRPPPAQQAPPPQEEPDLLFSSRAPEPTASLPQRPAPQASRPSPAQSASRPSPKPSPKPTPRPARQVPAVSSIAVQQSTKHRLAGTQHFKRGDYAAAHASYSNSLSGIPDSHPLVIVLLTNRALTALKTGEPKKAVEDSDAALKVIGPSGGQGEQVSVVGETGGEEQRDMRDLYGKALSRKAEALEQMERWSDAGDVWQIAVQAGVGGSTAVTGRQRCQNALKPKPKPKPSAAAPVRRPAARPSAAAAAQSSEAVERLRKQNQAAAAEDDEKFALSEKVDARIAAWRDGKRDNLRALLGSLDSVLWENSGWKKVGLHEIVMANKVKIVYMKAIAKTHPDKLPQDASTEVRLIAATVFATLNESWDKFKADNGL
ncbi:UBA/TS-N domain-containing protein [Plectosphaerella plurivora]|uniref:UBA/TS-N domain-containing protein n=1 Tax=Plectosphaerella plurivora TaxID=936078 RepID=A0A9P9ADG5_9PEZI|nr:UBA/TS-N domain-containing protein [Plectosphaerella plurivora]